MFNFALKREQQRALRHLFEGKEFGKSLVFQLLVLVEVGSEKQKAWRSRLRQYMSFQRFKNAIDDQVLEVNSVRYVSLNIVYESAEAVLDNHCSTQRLSIFSDGLACPFPC